MADEKQTTTSKFTAESGLGFMYVLQVFNVLAIIFELLSLLFVTGSQMPIDMLLIALIVDLVAHSVLVWMVAKRKIYTRQYAVVAEVITFLVLVGQTIVFGRFSLETLLANALVPALISIYFLTSRRAKAVLVQPFDVRAKDKDLDAQVTMWNPRSVDFWLRLLIYFFVFSVLGHWMEMGVQILVINGLFPGTIAASDSLTWKDNLNPFFIYGIAVAICGLVLFPVYVKLKQVMPKLWMAFVVSFLINMAFCVLAELILGFLCNADYHAWDYRNQFLNFQGQICLLYSIAFGVFSSIITWLIYPFMEQQFSYVGKDMFRVIFVASLVIFALLIVLYNVDLVAMGVIDKSMADALTQALRFG